MPEQLPAPQNGSIPSIDAAFTRLDMGRTLEQAHCHGSGLYAASWKMMPTV